MKKRRQQEYVLYIDGLPVGRRPVLELRRIARGAAEDRPRRDGVALYVRDWSAPNGLRLVKDYMK